MHPQLLRQLGDPEDKSVMREDESLVGMLSSALVHHMLPPVALTGGGTKLGHKFHAVAFTLFLEAGHSAASLNNMCDEIVTLTTDLGTEYLLPKVAPVDVNELFPWLQQHHPGLEKEGAEMELLLDDPTVHLSFNNAMGLPGLLHIIHNAAADVLTVTPLLDQQIANLGLVCDLLSNGQSRARLLERCFNTSVGFYLRDKLKNFNHRVYRGRWGSVAFAVQALLDVRVSLTHAWSLEKYAAEQPKVGKELREVDAAIHSAYFWGCMEVLNMLYSLVRDAFLWAESCPCHGHLCPDDVPLDARQRWQTCPLRGLRLPEVCAGDFFNNFRRLGASSGLLLLTRLPPGITAQERSGLLQAFAVGRSHLLYTFTLKLGAYTVPPLLLGAAAHQSRMVRALRSRHVCVPHLSIPKFWLSNLNPSVVKQNAF